MQTLMTIFDAYRKSSCNLVTTGSEIRFELSLAYAVLKYNRQSSLLTNEVNECPYLGQTGIDSLVQQTRFLSTCSVLSIGATRIRYGPVLVALVGETGMFA